VHFLNEGGFDGHPLGVGCFGCLADADGSVTKIAERAQARWPTFGTLLLRELRVSVVPMDRAHRNERHGGRPSIRNWRISALRLTYEQHSSSSPFTFCNCGLEAVRIFGPDRRYV